MRPVQRESTPSILARRLREAIVAGELAPGERLGEVELAAELGVSRGPLREAMQRLTQEGLLVSVPNRGLFVTRLTEQDVRDVYLARTAVERAALTEILHQEATADRLSDVLGRMARAAERGDEDLLRETDLEFHERLVALAGSPRLTRMHATLVTETRMCLRDLQGAYAAPVDRVREHEDIVAALRRGDGPGADRLLVAHMEDGLARLGAGRL
ncbi:GntR family transcriptional regulator, partial [Georgenia sp. 10Sc9-8]|nr:GntR family transcriptional regulator [Georgenia halotolerans]